MLTVLGLHCSVGFSLVAASGDYFLAAVSGLPTAVASLVAWSTWSRARGLQWSWFPGSRT